MAQRIKIKRSNSATNPADLKEGELAYIHSNNTAGNLYIGRPGTGDASTGLCSSIDIVGGLIDHTKLSGIDTGAEVNPDQVSAGERTAGTATDERSFSPADIKSMVDTHALTGLSAATSSALGAIKLHSDTAQTTAPETVSTTANRSYSVQLDANSKASVNVPWTDTTYTLPTATSTALGGIELFSDTDQTTAAESVTTTANRTYGIQLNSDNQAVVNVPWTDTGYTLPTATSTVLGGIELFSNTTQTTAANAVTATAGKTYGIQLNSDGQAVVNVPWSNTQRAIHDSPVDGATTTSISSNWAFDNVKTAVPANALFTDTTYTGGTGVTVNASEEISIGQAVGTTDDVTFDDLTLTGNIQLDDSGEIKFTSEGLAYNESTNTITSTRIIFDEWDYDSYSVNELGDISRAILKLGASGETMPAEYVHLFDYNNSGTFGSDDTIIFLQRMQAAVSATKYSNVLTGISNSSDYATTLIADLKDGDYDVASASDGSISLGSSSSRFKDINLSGDATIGGNLDVGGTVSIGDIVTQSSTSPVIKLKDSSATHDDYKIAVQDDEFELTQHTDLDEAGDTSLSILKAKLHPTSGGVLMAIGGAYDGNHALAVTGGVICTGNLNALSEVNLGAAAVAASGGDPAIPAKDTTVKGSLTVDGDLTVSGTTTTVNTETINLADNIIELNSNVGANNATQNAGIEVNRGNYTNVQLFWDETNHDWRVDTVGDVASGATTSPLLTSNNFETNITELDGGDF